MYAMRVCMHVMCVMCVWMDARYVMYVCNVCVCMYVCTCGCVYVCMHVCLYACSVCMYVMHAMYVGDVVYACM